MTVYRIAQKPYIEDLSGMGAFLYGGRWNFKGTYALYTAGSISLAYLEFLVHQFERETWPKDLMISEIEISDADLIRELAIDELPKRLNELRYHGDTQSIGPRYFSEGLFGIKVPSVIVPRESNVILNPKHPDYDASIKLVQIEPLELDKRFGIT